MSIEEAGEVILQGVAWRKCPNCEGGYVVTQISPDLYSKAKDFPMRLQCKDCEGAGALLAPRYKEACEALDIPLPSPWRAQKRGSTTFITGPTYPDKEGRTAWAVHVDDPKSPKSR